MSATEKDCRGTAFSAEQHTDLNAAGRLRCEHRLGPVRRVDRISFLIERARGKRVLHLGCAAAYLDLAKDPHLHAQLAAVANELWGLDLSARAISQLREAGFANLICGDAERLGDIDDLRDQHFDVIIAGELIEHLSNPGLFLNGCKALCSADTELILTTPN